MHYNFKRLATSRLIAENLLLFLLQLIGVKFCLLGDKPLPIDFAAGTAAAFIFMRGYTILPGIWLGTACAAILSGISLTTSWLLASCYTIQTGLLFYLCLRYIAPGLVFINPTLFLRFAALCFLIAIPTSPIIPWQANTAGLLIVTLSITYWDMYFAELSNWRKIPNLMTLVAFFTLALLLNLISLFIHMNNIGIFIFLLVVTLIWNNLRIISEAKHVITAIK